MDPQMTLLDIDNTGAQDMNMRKLSAIDARHNVRGARFVRIVAEQHLGLVQRRHLGAVFGALALRHGVRMCGRC